MAIRNPKVRPKQEPARRQITRYYRALQRAYGRQHWWPANSRFEVILGAFLTQNTSWRNVELALANLRRTSALSPSAIRRLREEDLAKLIRPAGYFRQKARRIKNFVAHVDARFRGSFNKLLGGTSAPELAAARENLLSLNGVGPETADSILLYAGHQPIFVVDAYTRRVLERHRLIQPGADYDEIRTMVEQDFADSSLAPSPEKNLGHKPSRMSRAQRSDLAQHYGEFHGLLVAVGKRHCRKHGPLCSGCPLERFLPQESWSEESCE